MKLSLRYGSSALLLLLSYQFTLAKVPVESSDDSRMSGLQRFNTPSIESAANGAAFFDESDIKFRSTWYSRDRRTSDGKDQIRVSAVALGIDALSGYAWGLIGFDLTANLSGKLGASRGWSEVLFHDLENNQERSNATIGQAALKLKFTNGNGNDGLYLRAGYTPIDVGTLGTSGGLLEDAYRGLQAKYQLGALTFGYGWADRFRNEWDDRYSEMTSGWHQNRGPFAGTANKINYIHSLGVRYAATDAASTLVDAGIGEGDGYRRNGQLAVATTIPLGANAANGNVRVTGYAFGAKYLSALSEFTDPSMEWHLGSSATYTRGPLALSAGFATTRAPDSGEMNFRLTAWANSDNRNYIQTWGQLDDFVWHGQKVVKLGLNYDLSDALQFPGLSAGISTNLSVGLRNQDGSTGRMRELDGRLSYAVQGGPLKDMTIDLLPGRLVTQNFSGKQSRSDIKFIVGYACTFDKCWQ
ncbi:outer membrane porin, OprD family [Collimonas sp. OK307]|uniref:OprD family outer membrane porin n=1 Tax=Collimonas sp. OK307 TaxID=1801620 RepID=UPI0008F326FF|nr:OprD family outer membrane porin [Collimonas sp. OK307]SFH86099.1 outer membrane porin, OprD family [Collimonas sp. OK307]